MTIGTIDVEQVVSTIWEHLLGLPIGRGDEAALPSRNDGCLTGCIQIAGAWRGAVTLVSTHSMARRIAAAMFALEESSIPNDMIQDALGEVTNMTAGNLKSLLPETCFLGLPTVVEGSDYGIRVSDSRLLARIPFQCQDEPFHVSLVEAIEAPIRKDTQCANHST